MKKILILLVPALIIASHESSVRAQPVTLGVSKIFSKTSPMPFPEDVVRASAREFRYGIANNKTGYGPWSLSENEVVRFTVGPEGQLFVDVPSEWRRITIVWFHDNEWRRFCAKGRKSPFSVPDANSESGGVRWLDGGIRICGEPVIPALYMLGLAARKPLRLADRRRSRNAEISDLEFHRLLAHLATVRRELEGEIRDGRVEVDRLAKLTVNELSAALDAAAENKQELKERIKRRQKYKTKLEAALNTASNVAQSLRKAEAGLRKKYRQQRTGELSNELRELAAETAAGP